MSLPLPMQLRACGLPVPVGEYRFAPPRRWRFDYAWPDLKLAVEVDGGIWTRGRHTRGAGVLKDNEKLNTAVLNGWRVLRVTPTQVCDGSAITLIGQALNR